MADNEFFEFDKIDIINSIDYFEYLDAFFGNSEKFKKITAVAKTRHYFQLQRTIAKIAPVLAQYSNVNGANAVALTEMWHSKLCKDGQDKPQWSFTKSIKGDGNFIATINNADASLLSEVCNVELSSIKQLLKEQPDLIRSALAQIKTIMNGTY